MPSTGANPTITSYIQRQRCKKFTTQLKEYPFFRIKNIFLIFKKALAYYNAGVVCSCKFKSRGIGSRINALHHLKLKLNGIFYNSNE
jgi:hypothetical protein